MNSNYGKSNNFDFDLGLSSNNPSRSLNHQKNQTQPSSIRSNTTTSYSTSQPRPSWTHQSSALPTGPTSMVGDIFGKTWSSSTTANTTSTIGIVNNKNPNLFGDLVTSALGQNKGNSNVPLKNVTPVSAPPRSNENESAKVGNSVKGGGISSNWGTSSQSFGSYTSNSSNVNNNIKNANLGGSSMRGFGGGIGGMSGSNKDPFGSLVDFGSKPAPKGNNKSTTGDDAFGNFQNAAKSNTPGFTSVPFPANSSNTTGLNSGPFSNLDDFAIPVSQNQPPPVESSGMDVFDSLFTATSASAGGVSKGSEGVGSQQFSGADDWESEFGGGNDMVGTTELEGLPPPPAGVSASIAKNKGMDNYKQGQYADAIKWLSWAVILLEKASNDAATTEVLSSRASCYKEVGEYKKAVADCTKVLQHDGENIAVLVQRALLYESMEKYKLGAEDLRTVMKLDPTNRVAKSTIHRLIKMAD